MKKFSSQYIFTNSGMPLKRGIITTDDEGVILNVEDTGGSLAEQRNVEFYNGLIIPGFVNCHCHLELSHLKGIAQKGTGLGDFIQQVRSKRETGTDSIIVAAKKADENLYREGVVLCADICNTDYTFRLKKESLIKYINLLEAFGIDPSKAQKRISEILKVADVCNKSGLDHYIVPHAVYSTSLTLFRLIKELSSGNKVTSIHFMETDAEKEFISNHTGPIAASYIKSGLMPECPDTVTSHTDAILNEITSSGNLIVVHNTCTDRETEAIVNRRGNMFWCLCPGSNLYIEDKLPPVEMLKESGCVIVIGTDSLASNDKISILHEMKLLQDNFLSLSLEEIIQWATINGACALGESEKYGSIEPGKKPGLLLLKELDLVSLRLLPDTSVKRLI